MLVKLEAGVAVASAVGVAAETGNADLEAGVGGMYLNVSQVKGQYSQYCHHLKDFNSCH